MRPDDTWGNQSVSSMNTVAICAIQQNESPYLLEWIAFHLNAGVDHIRVYDNDSSDMSLAILNAIAAKYPISVVAHPTVRGVSPQLSAYRDGIDWLRGRTEFVAFIDLDEFLFGEQSRPLREILHAVDNDVAAIGINQRIFGSNAETEFHPELVTARFTHRAPIDAPGNQFFKSIARVRQIREPNIHNVVLATGLYVFSDGSALGTSMDHPGRATRIVRGQIVLHHYLTKSRAEFETKRLRGGAAASTAETRKGRHTAEGFDWINLDANSESDMTLWSVADRTRAKMREILGAVGANLPREAIELYQPLV